MEIEKKLTTEQQAALDDVRGRPDGEIDLSDAPELTDWTGAVRGIDIFKQKHGAATIVNAIADDFDDPLPEDFPLRPLPPEPGPADR
jgi:hypothetical protein